VEQIIGEKPHFQPSFVRREPVAAFLVPAQRVFAFLDPVFNIAP
jgi:hypothetical protein